jgi:hypothetical protein
MSCSAGRSTKKSDENAPAQAIAPVPLRSQRDIKLRELLERCGLIERLTPYVAGGRGALRGDEARKWLEKRRNEAIAELTLAVATIAMLAAIVAAVRR